MVTDVVLHGAGGLVLADRARTMSPDLPVLFMSGYPDEELGAVTVTARGDGLIRKPFSATRLLNAVRDRLRHKPHA